MTEKQITVPEMVRLTANNSLEFMKQIAEHIEKLEQELARVTARIAELEASNGDNNSAQ
jgi:uncharacterized protein (UPF0335 family)